MTTNIPKQRLLILGGGPSALTTAWQLTSTEDLRQRYDITVLQMGWRLGGKGASGRNPEVFDRIEEHGLHIMFGFYDNFFSMIQKAYDELGRPAGAPLATWREAFHPGEIGVLGSFHDQVWTPFIITLPRNNAVPGVGGALLDSKAYFAMLLGGGLMATLGWEVTLKIEDHFFPTGKEWEQAHGDPSQGSANLITVIFFAAAQKLLQLAGHVEKALEERVPELLKILEKLRNELMALLETLAENKPKLLFLLQGIDFITALIQGLIADQVLEPGGFDKIDQYDFAEWLVRHGMLAENMDSPCVRFIYYASFSYKDGDAAKKRMAAGTALICLMRMATGSKGAVYYRMQAGMGDTIMTPLYQILAERGVKFRFFHQVSSVEADDARVTCVRAWRQAELRSGDPLSYAPLIDVKGLPSWPDRPLYDQLQHPETLKNKNLESYYEGHEGETEVVFRDGVDFDHVVLATPISTLPYIAPELCKRPAWAKMCKHVAAVQTVALQLWFKKDLKELGWPTPAPLLSEYAEPLSTYSDMSQTLDKEAWPPELEPKNVSYFCGDLPGPSTCPPVTDRDFPARELAKAEALVLPWVKTKMGPLFPKAVDATGCLDWSLLVDPQNQQGEARLKSQYLRANCEPSERCTLALPGTNQYRLTADGSGINNLTLTGDWIDNGISTACLEGAVMSGIQAARAVSGICFPIIGEFLDEGVLPWDVQRPAPAGLLPLIKKFPPDQKVRVAVLGSGIGAMSAVWGLLQSPYADRFEINVYQYGWRLGGKCASGRNAAFNQRIEEHGLHIFSGMYDNAFRMMQECYAQLDRNPAAPLSTWYDPTNRERSAFWPHSLLSLAEFDAGAWSFWNVEMPTNNELPGNGKLLNSLRDYIQLMVKLLEDALHGTPEASSANGHGVLREIWHRAEGDTKLETEVRRFEEVVGKAAFAATKRALDAMPHDRCDGSAGEPVIAALSEVRDHFEHCFSGFFATHPSLRHFFELLDLGTAIIKGCIRANVLMKGFDVVDGIGFSDWLGQNGARPMTIAGGLNRGWHDFFFAGLKGDAAQPLLSAATALRTMFRYILTYKGAFFWKMQAGMGDTIFAPLYEVMKRRGVKFHFFHRVTSVSNVAQQPTWSIQRIEMERQVDILPTQSEYSPLIDVLGVPSWPSKPLYAQIDPAQALQLQAENIDLESAWTPWKPVGTVELLAGRDFDLVILGTSIEPLKTIAPSLLAGSPPLKRLVEGLPTNQTLAMQLWLDQPLDTLGWTSGSTVGAAYAEPHNTWANMDYLLAREDYSGCTNPPKSLIYFCGIYPDAQPIPPFSDSHFPHENSVRVNAFCTGWLSSQFGALYPNASRAGTPQINWDRLYDARQQTGTYRFDSQYWRGNIDPSERYVLATPNTAAIRLRAQESGFDNLLLAGDWLYTGLNVGCVEAAMMGGLQASRAITGYPQRIPGDTDPGWGRPDEEYC